MKPPKARSEPSRRLAQATDHDYATVADGERHAICSSVIFFSRRSEGGIAPVSGTGDRGFESRRFDQKIRTSLVGVLVFLVQVGVPT